MGFSKFITDVHTFIAVLSILVVLSNGSTHQLDSNVLLSQGSTANDESGKRSEGKSGMWFGPRLGRSLQRHPIFETDNWIPEDERPQMIFDGKRMRKNRHPNTRYPDLERLYVKPDQDQTEEQNSPLGFLDLCFVQSIKLSNSSGHTLLSSMFLKDCRQLYSKSVNYDLDY